MFFHIFHNETKHAQYFFLSLILFQNQTQAKFFLWFLLIIYLLFNVHFSGFVPQFCILSYAMSFDAICTFSCRSHLTVDSQGNGNSESTSLYIPPAYHNANLIFKIIDWVQIPDSLSISSQNTCYNIDLITEAHPLCAEYIATLTMSKRLGLRQ